MPPDDPTLSRPITRTCATPWNPTNPNAENIRKQVQAAADALERRLIVGTAVVEGEIEPSVTRLVQQRIGALLIRPDLLFNGRSKQLVALATRYALPAIHPLREFATAGGLMSYGASLREALRQTASMLAGFFRARRWPTYRSSSPRKLSWSSTSRLQRRSASLCRFPCSVAPTR